MLDAIKFVWEKSNRAVRVPPKISEAEAPVCHVFRRFGRRQRQRSAYCQSRDLKGAVEN